MSLSKKGTSFYSQQPAHRTIGTTERTASIEMLTEPWECYWSYDNHSRRLSLPVGYVWDGASVPRVAWSVIGLTPWGLTDGPSLAHDPLYRSRGGVIIEPGVVLCDEHGDCATIDRREADWLFWSLFVYAGINNARAATAYGVVRAFGNRHWGGPSPTPTE
jgi:hypothetical protein